MLGGVLRFALPGKTLTCCGIIFSQYRQIVSFECGSLESTSLTTPTCILYYIVSLYVILYNILLYYNIVLYDIVCYCMMLYAIVLYCIILYYIVSYCLILYQIVIQYIILNYIVFYYGLVGYVCEPNKIGTIARCPSSIQCNSVNQWLILSVGPVFFECTSLSPLIVL